MDKQNKMHYNKITLDGISYFLSSKNKIKIILLLIAISFLISSCNSKKETHFPNAITEEIIIDPDKFQERVDGTFLIDTNYIEFIPLETNDNCLIAEAKRISLRNDKIIVYDPLSVAAFIFNRDGKFHAKVQNLGNGPGEYPPIVSDIVVTEKYIGVLASNIGKIIFYDFDGKYTKEISIKGKWGFSFFTFDDEKYYLINDFQNVGAGLYSFFTIDENKGIDECFLPFNKHDEKVKRGWGIDKYFSKLGEHAYIIIGSMDTIYRVSPTEDIHPKYYVNIIKNQLPKEDREGPANLAIRKSIMTNSILGMYGIMESDKYLFLDFHDFTCIYDKSDKKIIQTAQFYEIDLFGNYILPFHKYGNLEDGKYLIDSYNPIFHDDTKRAIENGKMQIKNPLFRKKFLNAFNKLKDESDNPIVIIYKLK